MVKLSGKEQYPIYFGANSELLRIASDLRKLMTPAEKILWEQLRNRKLSDYRFRRQHPIGEFVVDFFCYEAMLVIEIDGEIHDTSYQRERDIERKNILQGHGIREIRFRNEDVMNNLENVLAKILREIKIS